MSPGIIRKVTQAIQILQESLYLYTVNPNHEHRFCKIFQIVTGNWWIVLTQFAIFLAPEVLIQSNNSVCLRFSILQFSRCVILRARRRWLRSREVVSLKMKNAETTSFLRLKPAKTTGCLPKTTSKSNTLFNCLINREHMIAHRFEWVSMGFWNYLRVYFWEGQ